MIYRPSIVAAIKKVEPNQETITHSLPIIGRHALMWACCLLMAIGVGFVIWPTLENQSVITTLLSLSPLLACVGMHIVMHRFMGKSCHGDSNQKETRK